MLPQLPQAKPSKKGLLTIIILSTLLVGALVFGVWAFVERLDYKDNSDQKAAAAVQKALEEQKVSLKAEYDEEAKNPYEIYSGPSSAGSLTVTYPRQWSAYVTEDAQAATPIVGYMHKGYVPKTQGLDAVAFALRFEVVSETYAQVAQGFDSVIKQGDAQATAYTLPKVSGSIGLKISGGIVPGNPAISGTMVIMPIRDKTLKIWTESNSAFGTDFENIILANLTFVP